MADRSEMARNAIESEFRTSKLADGSHFVKNFKKKLKFRIDLKWPEMRSKVNFGHPKWPTSAILSKIKKKIKVAYRSEMARNAIESEIRTSKMADVSHFVKNLNKKVAYRFEMARNEIESDFRTSKLAAGVLGSDCPKNRLSACMLIPHKGHTDTIQVYSVTVMPHAKVITGRTI